MGIEIQKLTGKVIEQISEAIIVIDTDTRINYLNKAAQELYGYDEYEVIGKTPKDFSADSDYEVMQKQIYKAIKNGKIWEGEYYNKKKNGDVFLASVRISPLFEENEIVAHVGIIQDITKEKEKETLIENSENKFFKAFYHSPMAKTITVTDTGEIIEVNEEFEKLTGYSREELMGKTTIELLILNEEERYKIVKKVKRYGHFKNIYVTCNTKHGAKVNLLVSVSKIDIGDKDCILTVAQDVTDRLKDEERLKEYATKLENSNSNLQQFASVIAHELREPLRSTLTFLEMFANDHVDEKDSNASECFANIKDNIGHMQKLINGMLSLAKIETDKELIDNIDLMKVVKMAITNLSRKIDESGAKISFNDLSCIIGDESQLVQVFSNLIKNSIKYSGDKTPVIDITSHLDVDSLIIRINDNGIGIDSDNLKNIFMVFNKSKTRDKDSFGLGLSICDRIIQKHGGVIWAESVKGEGSTFFIKLPTKPQE